MQRHISAIVLMAEISPAVFAEQMIDKSHGFNDIERMYIEQERVAINAIQNFRFIPSPDGADLVGYSFHWDIEDQTGVEIRTPRPPHGTTNFGQVVR